MSRKSNTATMSVSSEKVETSMTPEMAVKAYFEAVGAEKRKMRDFADKSLKDAIGEMDLQSASAWKSALDAMVPAKSEKSVSDPREAIARKVAILRMAANLLESGSVRPSGVSEEADLTGMSEFVGNVENESIVEDARKVASAKVTRSGDRHSIEDVIRDAFAKSDRTELKLSEIAKLGASEHYSPSQGAIAARMFGGKGVEGFVPVEATATTPRTVRVA